MTSWWQWNPSEGASRGGFAVIGVGRFGSAVCSELAKAGAEVLAIDASQRAIDELRQINPAIEARVVDCTDEEALRAAGVLDMDTVVVGSSPASDGDADLRGLVMGLGHLGCTARSTSVDRRRDHGGYAHCSIHFSTAHRRRAAA